MAQPLSVFLADLSYMVEGNLHNLYTPLNIGYCASYAKKKFGKDICLGLAKEIDGLLEAISRYKPAVVGFSLYYWNAELVRVASKQVKKINPETFIVLGGPCIDIDKNEQQLLFDRYPCADALVPNEGEQGFSNLIGRIISGSNEPTVPGATIRGNPQGAPIGLSTDLNLVPSPYLEGYLDTFLGGEFQPLIQTSRLCPYTCAFCVSGKDRGKLRAFSLDVVKAEIEYICSRWQGDPKTLFYITDENFGIMERDLEVADMINEARTKHNYPNRIFYYNDKRFTQISRALHEKVGEMCWHGVCLSLQSENPEALKAIKRRNLTDEQIKSALEWAKGLKLKTSTELIFGLPGETLQSFLNLIDKCAYFGFDIINCYNLMLFGGIEMNRARYRQEHKLVTRKRFRVICDIFGEKIAETDEIVISSTTFSVNDFIIISKMGHLLDLIYRLNWNKEEIMSLVKQGRSLTGLLLEFMTPEDDNDMIAQAHNEIIRGLEKTVFKQYEGGEDFMMQPDPPNKVLVNKSLGVAVWQRTVDRFLKGKQ